MSARSMWTGVATGAGWALAHERLSIMDPSNVQTHPTTPPPARSALEPPNTRPRVCPHASTPPGELPTPVGV